MPPHTAAERRKKKPLSEIAAGIKRRGTKGALRNIAKRMGLIKGDETLSAADLDALARRGGTKTKRRVALARTFAKHRPR